MQCLSPEGNSQHNNQYHYTGKYVQMSVHVWCVCVSVCVCVCLHVCSGCKLCTYVQCSNPVMFRII